MKKQSLIVVPFLLILFAVLTIIAPETGKASASFADGEYTVSFEVLKDTSDEISATSDYMVSPAKLMIEKGKMYAVVTLKNSSWWQYFETQAVQSESFSDVTILSEDSDHNTRIVKFEISNMEQYIHAKIHIIVSGIPGFVYDNKYDIRFKFDYSDIPLATDHIPDTEQENQIEQPDITDVSVPSATNTENRPELDEDTRTETEVETEIVTDETTTGAPESPPSDESFEDSSNNQLPDQSIDQPAAELNTKSTASSQNKMIGFTIIALAILIAVLLAVLRARRK